MMTEAWSEMGRVHLTAGAVGLSKVRLNPRGASERLRAPGQDINDAQSRKSASLRSKKTSKPPSSSQEAGRGRASRRLSNKEKKVVHLAVEKRIVRIEYELGLTTTKPQRRLTLREDLRIARNVKDSFVESYE
jgi:hypothetical protein